MAGTHDARLHEAAVVWIDTDGQFKIESCETKLKAAFKSRMTNECGLPAVIVTRSEILNGEFKNNAQLEEEEDAEDSSVD